MGRGVNDAFAVRREVRAGRAALTGTYSLQIRTIRFHGENLIAFVRLACGLKNELLSICGKVRFGVVARGGQLANILQMLFVGMRLKRRLLLSGPFEGEGRDEC